MSLFEAARMAVHGVLANRLRSFLTLLGIAIALQITMRFHSIVGRWKLTNKQRLFPEARK